MYQYALTPCMSREPQPSFCVGTVMGMELPELQQDFARETTVHSTQLQLRSANLTSISSPSICLPPQRRQASIPAGHPKAIMGAAGAGKGGIWGTQVLTSPEHRELPAVPAAAELSSSPPHLQAEICPPYGLHSPIMGSRHCITRGCAVPSARIRELCMA